MVAFGGVGGESSLRSIPICMPVGACPTTAAQIPDHLNVAEQHFRFVSGVIHGKRCVSSKHGEAREDAAAEPKVGVGFCDARIGQQSRTGRTRRRTRAEHRRIQRISGIPNGL